MGVMKGFMALEMKESSGWWYGRYMVNGDLRRVNLGVRICGVRPISIREIGDAAFEQSRGKAQAKHDEVLGEITSKKTSEELVQRVIEIKTGTRVNSVRLDSLC